MGIHAGLSFRCGGLRWGALSVGLLAGWAACQPATEGCLDFRALAVDVGADEPCDDCCQYPALVLQFVGARLDPDVDTIVSLLDRGSVYVDGAGDTVTLDRLSFFVSDLALVAADGSTVPLLDTFGFRQNSSDARTTEEAGLLRVTPLQTPRLRTGRLLADSRFVALRGRLGLPGRYAASDPAALAGQARFALAVDSGIYDFAAVRYRGAIVRRNSTQTGADSVLVDGGDVAEFTLVFAEPLALGRSFDLNLTVALPIAELIDLPAGVVTAETMVTDFLAKARVVDISVGR